MPKAEEVCEVTINGSKFRDWDSVRVEQQAGGDKGSIAMCQLSVTEAIGGKVTWATLQIKPGDKATVTLAGKAVCTGFVTQRQASYDANNHGVLILIKSKITDIVDSSAPLKSSEFRDYPLKAIAEKLIQPFGIQLKVENPSKSFDKKFKEVNIIPGESVHSVIERLARMRGMDVHDDENGNLVIASGTTGQGADLIEGRNILSANCLIQDESAMSEIGVPTQQRGDDQTDDEKARKPSGSVKGPSDRHRPLIVPAEHPEDSETMSHRAEREAAYLESLTVNARITVQGWLQDSGDLWKIRQTIAVNSPMLLLTPGFKLGVQTLLFTQDNSTGTTTTLELVKLAALGAIGQAGGGGGGGNEPGGDSVAGTPDN